METENKKSKRVKYFYNVSKFFNFVDKIKDRHEISIVITKKGIKLTY